MLSQLQQIVGICHRSCPGFILENGLLGRAAETKIREDTPSLEWLEFLVNRGLDLVRGGQQLVAPTSPVGEDHSEEDSRISAPVLFKRIPQTHDIGAKGRLDFFNSLFAIVQQIPCR